MQKYFLQLYNLKSIGTKIIFGYILIFQWLNQMQHEMQTQTTSNILQKKMKKEVQFNFKRQFCKYFKKMLKL